MEIREATEEDIPEIVSLLKLTLGESLTPKSERYWRWKHLENPFGKSIVSVCCEGGKLVGVRAFMRWEWVSGGEIFKAVRAVDTATHPDFQRKGIFTKLNRSLVENCKKSGYHFVFNTPNKQSKLGSLKMGWEEIGKLPVRISVQRPYKMLKNFIFNPVNPKAESEISALNHYLDHSKLDVLIKDYHGQISTTVTNISVPYLKWRYLNVPVAQYVGISDGVGEKLTGLIIARIKRTRFGRELRITDCLLGKTCNKMELMEHLRERTDEWSIDYTTLSGATSSDSQRIFYKINAKLSVGPMVTVRSLNMNDLLALKNFNQWSPSLGDLELF